MKFDYEKLLDEARNKLPESVLKTERFEIPKVQGHVQGSKTVITNFKKICGIFHREPQHLIKFLLRELATSGETDDGRLILNRKLNSQIINNKIEQYANTFVLCKECKKPDTQLIKQEKLSYMKCMACGAKNPITTKI